MSMGCMVKRLEYRTFIKESPSLGFLTVVNVFTLLHRDLFGKDHQAILVTSL